MKIALQRLKDGNVRAFDLPAPRCGRGQVLVRTSHSVISSGTELSRLIAAKSSLFGKAMQRPAEFKKVLTAIKRKGFATTYAKVTNRLEQYNKIGYSSSGVVVATGPDVRHVKVGDPVALAGSGFAVHAEYTVVPANLCVKAPEGVALQDAAFATIGSIALQGVRQVAPSLGDTVAVIGLGLLGQLAVQILKANGVKVVGIDLVEEKLAYARQLGCEHVINAGDPGLEELVRGLSSGYGADAVLITASTKSTDPINLAGRLARKRGKVVIVGDIGHNFERGNYYEKELSILMSCSYGAGRYDPRYEIEGIDYPQAYVPWTIARNMGAFLWLLSQNRVSVQPLVTQVFRIEDAPAAYEKLLENRPDTFSIVFEYEPRETQELHTLRAVREPRAAAAGPNVGIIGVGNYARSFILPNLPRQLRVRALAARSPSSLVVKGLEDCEVLTTDPAAVIADHDVQTVIIATRHSSHGRLVMDAIRAGKNVYVEKPMVATRDELGQLAGLLSETGGNVCVGFNRRYSGAVKALQAARIGVPVESRYTVIADEFAEDYWALQESEGGIIVGEMIHFVDLLLCLHESHVARTHVVAEMKSANRGAIHATLHFENGSVATITYLMGAKIAGDKETIELYCEDDRILIEGFRKVSSAKRGVLYKARRLDMGREALFGGLLLELSRGRRVQDVGGLVASHAAAFAMKDSAASGAIVEVERYA